MHRFWKLGALLIIAPILLCTTSCGETPDNFPWDDSDVLEDTEVPPHSTDTSVTDPDTDTDHDTVSEPKDTAADSCPEDPLKDNPGECGCGNAETGDSDGDGTHDCNDECPSDPSKVQKGMCGCGNPDLDSDGDGSCDAVDACTGNDATGDTDNNGICNDSDPDDDGDGWPDELEKFCGSDPLQKNSTPQDDDGDNICNSLDLCSGNDDTGDTDSDGICDDNDPVFGWFAKDNLPFVAGALASAILSDGLHVLGGSTDYAGATRFPSHWVYSIATETWTDAPADIPDNDVWGAKAEAYNGKIYLAGGFPNGKRRFRVYDPSSNTWDYLPNIPDDYSWGFVSAVVGDYFYVIGGEAGNETNAPVHKYDLKKNKWSHCDRIPLNQGQGALAGAAWGDNIYVINGDEPGNETTLQIYDTVKDKWSFGPDLQAHHDGASAAARAGKIYFFGGAASVEMSEDFTIRSTVNIYDVASGNWSTAASMPTGRIFSTVQNIGPAFHVLGGFVADGKARSVHEIFVP